MKNFHQYIGLAMFLIFAQTVFCAVLSPTEQVKMATDEILLIVKEKGLDKEKRRSRIREKIREIVNDHFDFRSMSQSVLSTHWKTATAYEKDRFVEFFTLSLENTYTNVLDEYNGEEITYAGEKIKGDRASVDTVILSGSKKIPVTYKMKLNGSEWFAYDVVIENVSLVSTYRNLYSNIVKSEGISGLLDRMQLETKGVGIPE